MSTSPSIQLYVSACHGQLRCYHERKTRTHFDLPSDRVWLTINTDKNSTIDSYATGQLCNVRHSPRQPTVKQQCHGLADRPRQELDDGDDKQCDLDRRADLIVSLKMSGMR